MATLKALVWPDNSHTHVRVEHEGRTILQARLAPMERSHPMAMRTLLEALALWQTSSLFAVLAVDRPEVASSWAPFRSDRVEVVPCAVSRPRSVDALWRMVAHVQLQRVPEVRHAR